MQKVNPRKLRETVNFGPINMIKPKKNF